MEMAKLDSKIARQDADDYQNYLKMQEGRKKFQRELLSQQYDESIKIKKDNDQLQRDYLKLPDNYDHLMSIGTNHSKQLER